ncbi:AAA family ATPase [Actinotalea subterranea]|uniref:AAA family ATPase n=1 Tax=Actinotalea subterranea TaxID=2607497 RepID=UPI0011EE9B0D|nr:hypothetical protein [Actinotalea subterranea]
MTAGVLCAVRGGAETAVVRDLGASAGRLDVTRRCADLGELLAAAAAGLGHVAVVSTDLPGLDREAVNHLHGSGVRVVALADDRAGWPAARVWSLGVDAVVPDGSAGTGSTDAVLQVLADADEGLPPGARAAAAGVVTARSTANGSAAGAPMEQRHAARLGPASSQGVLPDHAGERTAREPSAGVTADHLVPGSERGGASPGPAAPPGTVVAVWGPTGAPGRTTVAVNLAAELAALVDPGRDPVLLVDADTYGGTIAQMLGLLDEAPGIAAAARAAAVGRLDDATLAGLTPALDSGLRVLTGLTRADRWPEVPASALDVVWAAARRLATWTVVDCGFAVEQDEALSYDTRAPRRNAATLSALAEADVVVVVGAGDPIGLQRLVRALGELSELGVPPEGRVVVVNRVRASASGPRPEEAIRDALRRYAGVTRVELVPDDRATCDAAVLAARTLAEQAPGSPARRAVAALARALVPAPATAGAH